MKKIIFLIISSHHLPVYKIMREIIVLYFEKMKKIYPIDYFFVEFDNNITEEVCIIKNNILVKGEESIIPGMIIKTHKALKFINNNYNYDILIRTNLSSFWNIPYLYKISENFKENNLATGVIIFSSFITGTGIIITKDIAISLEKIINYENTKINEDLLISEYLKDITTITALDETNMFYLCKGVNNEIPDNIENILYFRIKSDGDRCYDGETFKILLKQIYDINYNDL